MDELLPIATFAFNYFNALCKAGFNEPQALILTGQRIESMVNTAQAKEPPAPTQEGSNG